MTTQISILKNYWLKVYAILVNKFYIYSEFITNRLRFKNNVQILFSEKEWWDHLLLKGPYTNRYQPQFLNFENAEFKTFDLVVPLTIPDLEYCIKNESLLSNNPIPFPSQKSFNICNDKSEFNQFMKSNGFQNFLPANYTENKFPFILKKKQDEGGENTFIINNYFDVDTYKEFFTSSDFIKQGIIPGEKEYATHIIIRNGKIVNALTIVYTFKTPFYVKGKDQYICRNISKNKYLDLFEDILNKMEFNGLCCFNYKEQNGNPIIFEINPRFGVSVCDFFYPFVQKVI